MEICEWLTELVLVGKLTGWQPGCPSVGRVWWPGLTAHSQDYSQEASGRHSVPAGGTLFPVTGYLDVLVKWGLPPPEGQLETTRRESPCFSRLVSELTLSPVCLFYLLEVSC